MDDDEEDGVVGFVGVGFDAEEAQLPFAAAVECGAVVGEALPDSADLVFDPCSVGGADRTGLAALVAIELALDGVDGALDLSAACLSLPLDWSSPALGAQLIVVGQRACGLFTFP
ncbi:MAG: hypothetical protein AB7V42_16100 [Thermoleophilia bacterium]